LDSEDYKQLVYEEIQLYHDGDKYEEYERIKRENPEGVLHKRFAHKQMHTVDSDADAK